MRASLALIVFASLTTPLAASAEGRCSKVAGQLASAFNALEYPQQASATPKLELVESKSVNVGEDDETSTLETWRVLYPHQDGYLVNTLETFSCSAQTIRTRAPGGKPVDYNGPRQEPAYACGTEAVAAMKTYLNGRGLSSKSVDAPEHFDFSSKGYPGALGYESWVVRNSETNRPVVLRYQNGRCQFIAVQSDFAN